MSSQVQYCHPRLLIYTLCAQCEIISVNASCLLQPFLYHRQQFASPALWSHHSHYNGTSVALNWDFTRTHTPCSGPLLHGSFIKTKLCMHRENKSAWTHWQERARQRSRKMHKKNNIKETWRKLHNAGRVVSLPKWHLNIQIIQQVETTSVIQWHPPPPTFEKLQVKDLDL